MRQTAVLLAVAALGGAAEPVDWLPVEAAAELRLPDLGRSRLRWYATPYVRLVATPWGAVTVKEVSQRLSAIAPGADGVLASLRSGAASVEGSPGRMRLAAAAVGDAAGLRLLAGAMAGQPLPPTDGAVVVQGGCLEMAGDRLVWLGGADKPLAPVPRPPADAEADAEWRIDPARLALMWPDGAGLLPGGRDPIVVSVALDPAGLRERIAWPATPACAAAAGEWTRWADPAELRSLPAATLGAVTWTADPKALAAGVSMLVKGPAFAEAERNLSAAGLPGLADTLAACDGPCTAYLAEGVPFPTATIALSLAQPLAKRWIAAVAAKLNLAATADGGSSGFLGLVPLAIGWVDAPGGGRLVVTTDPAGLDAWRKRSPGFAEQPGVRESLATVSERCAVLGAGRGGAAWAPLAQLAVPLFAGMGNPHVVAMPNDLRTAGGRGWLQAVLARDGSWDIRSGGLFGGPACITGLVGASIPAVLWVQQQQARERKAAAPPPAEPKVF